MTERFNAIAHQTEIHALVEKTFALASPLLLRRKTAVPGLSNAAILVTRTLGRT